MSKFSTKKLHVKLTKDEIIFYNNIYNKLEKNEKGYIPSKIVANFMKTSGLDKNILKKIFLIGYREFNFQLNKDELFVILRLIALAQNNLPFTEENIRTNNPLSPLPTFNNCINNNIISLNDNQINFDNKNDYDNSDNRLSNDENNINDFNKQNSLFDLSDREKIYYKSIFDKRKEENFERIRAHNAIIFWKDNNIDDDSIRIIANLIKPLENKGFLNLKEFQVSCHLLNKSKSKNIKLPNKLPICFNEYLGRNEIIAAHNINKNNNILDKSPCQHSEKILNKYIGAENNDRLESQIKELYKQLKEEKNKNKLLTDENNSLRLKIMLLNSEIQKIDEMKKKIKLLENNLAKKSIEIQKYISQNRNKKEKYSIKSILPGEKIMAVNFVSMGNQDIGHYNLVCKNVDLFVSLEERLYEDFPKFKEYETYFEVKTKRIKRFKTLEENNINTNDIINIFFIEI